MCLFGALHKRKQKSLKIVTFIIRVWQLVCCGLCRESATSFSIQFILTGKLPEWKYPYFNSLIRGPAGYNWCKNRGKKSCDTVPLSSVTPKHWGVRRGAADSFRQFPSVARGRPLAAAAGMFSPHFAHTWPRSLISKCSRRFSGLKGSVASKV